MRRDPEGIGIAQRATRSGAGRTKLNAALEGPSCGRLQDGTVLFVPRHWDSDPVNVEEEDVCIEEEMPEISTTGGRLRNPSTFLAAAVLSALPIAAAAPPRPRSSPGSNSAQPTPRSDPTINTIEARNTDRLYPFDAPTALPTEVYILDETVLPYVLTQASDGTWEKAENGWSLIGRTPRVATRQILADDDPTSSTASFAIEQSLPTGWGQSSSRTSFYKVPLIVISSVILAVFIVSGIIFIVLSRRKAARRLKRRQERQRRKALIAAGIDPDETSGVVEAKVKNQLQSMEKQYRKKKKETVGMVRTKVISWNMGLRRRRRRNVDSDGKSVAGTVEVLEDEEDKPVDPGGEIVSPELRRESLDSRAGSLTTPRQSDESGSTPESGPSSSSSNSEPVVESSADAAPGPTPYFPPAYRPASVRSVEAGSSSTRQPDALPPPHPAEKTRAAGFYPAPISEDSEQAIAVVARRDGKARMPDPRDEVDENGTARGVAHVATDDKAVLERLRLGGSAPIELGPELDGAPSAPTVEVDEHGFETIDLHSPSEPPLENDSSSDTALALALPPPPRVNQRSISTFNEVAISDELHLLPSAPSPSKDIPAASAPPMEIDHDEVVIPSAPPLEMDDDDDDDLYDTGPVSSGEDTLGSGTGSSSSRHSGEEETVVAAGENNEEGPSSSNSSVRLAFLPRYEP